LNELRLSAAGPRSAETTPIYDLPQTTAESP